MKTSAASIDPTRMKTIQSRLACLLLAAALCLLAGGCHITTSDSSEPRLTAVAQVAQKGAIPADLETLEVDNSFGAVNVTAAEIETGEWSWTLTVRAQTDALAKEAADATKYRAEREGGRLRLAVAFPEAKGPRRFQSDFEIRLPKSVAVRTVNRFGRTTITGVAKDVDATGHHGSVSISSVDGQVRAKTAFSSLTIHDTGPATLLSHHGSINATSVRGSLDAETSFASLTARQIAGSVKLRNHHGSVETAAVKGDADIKTAFAALRVDGIEGDATLANQHGSVNARNISGSARASTAFAALELSNSGPNLTCRNQHGSIRLSPTASNLASIDAETSFGSLDVHLPAGIKPAIQARTTFADVESDFPVLMKPRNEEAFADVEPGTPRLTLQNQHGKIRVTRGLPVASR